MFSITTLLALMSTQPLMSSPLSTVPAVVTTTDPEDLSDVPAGTPVLEALGHTLGMSAEFGFMLATSGTYAKPEVPDVGELDGLGDELGLVLVGALELGAVCVG